METSSNPKSTAPAEPKSNVIVFKRNTWDLLTAAVKRGDVAEITLRYYEMNPEQAKQDGYVFPKEAQNQSPTSPENASENAESQIGTSAQSPTSERSEDSSEALTAKPASGLCTGEPPLLNCIHCSKPLWDNGTVLVHLVLTIYEGKPIVLQTQWCDGRRKTIGETELTALPSAPATRLLPPSREYVRGLQAALDLVAPTTVSDVLGESYRQGASDTVFQITECIQEKIAEAALSSSLPLPKVSENKENTMTVEQQLDAAIEALPDAFSRGAGSLADKINAYREFASGFIQEVQQCCKILPDSLERPLSERIKLLLERADRESKLAVELSKELENVCGGTTK